MGGGSSTGASYATAAPAPAEAAPLPNASSSASSGSVLGKGAERRVEAVASTRATSSASGAAESHSWHGTQDGRIREKLMQAIRFRKKYLHQAAVVPPVDPAADTTRATLAAGKVMVMVDGVAEIPGLELPAVPSRHDFKQDLIALWKIVKDPECKSTAMNRLERLSVSFQSYDLEQAEQERHDAAEIMGDLYSVMKVDNHIHLAAAMTPRMLLAFIKEKLQKEPEREVIKGKSLKKLIMEAVNFDETSPGGGARELDEERLDSCLHVDALRTVADDHFYHRFDNFNDAYSPLGCAHLRTVFLKSSNHIQGAYFGELAKAVIESYEQNDTYAEMRLSIYGKNLREWDDLAKWLKANDLHSSPATSRNLWMIQIPRVFGAFHKGGLISNFEELLNNIFQPLFEVALDPDTHPELAEVLPAITGVDSVDDESVPDQLCARRSQLYGEHVLPPHDGDVLRPQLWAVSENPPYSYYSFYIYVNLCRWNHLCQLLGRPWHLTFRPHAGEAGEVHHLATTFLLADGINHGVNLQHSPVLQYLYFITQIGISVSPLSNNSLFLKMSKNPFPDFFQRGLNVTLSTDDPLMFHATKEPLLEEYTTARSIFGLSMTDMCEIAAHSVKQSSFAPRGQPSGRVQGLSRDWAMDPRLSNIPQRRLNYRRRCLARELRFLQFGLLPAAEVPDVPEKDLELEWSKLDF
ncbi:unnamed protein product [Durusdinium trenchii]|uniref:AMP deaminase n=1 Tax=Durusdinium trenchii TaxID=1381693 RepID=A0ABP0RH72_9DINO